MDLYIAHFSLNLIISIFVSLRQAIPSIQNMVPPCCVVLT